jgi:hypothetical protein
VSLSCRGPTRQYLDLGEFSYLSLAPNAVRRVTTGVVLTALGVGATGLASGLVSLDTLGTHLVSLSH